MARVPFIGRLFWREYLALFGSLILIFLEVIIRIITLGLPQPIIRFCYNRSKSLFNLLSSPQGRQSRSRKKSISTSIAQSSDFVDLCALYGYYAEEHIVQTGDGYLLGLHRLGWRRGEESSRVNSGEGSVRKKVVYLHHGLLMNSEVWVCITDKERCLPFMLVEKGYDVWLGNNRGNKYSKKSTQHSPSSIAFWDFSMDQFAFHDIPDSIDYVLKTTYQPSLSYIGFSQGTAQAFATLSIHPLLNDKVDVFIALAPAMSPAGLSNGIVDALIKASPEVIFLAFGRRSILSAATMWQAILYPPIFTRIIDMSLSFLFGWSARNINAHQKLAAYPHLYSFSSTKSVVHWFQIIRNKSFQMYDDDVQVPLGLGASDRYYKVAKFPTRNIKTPIVLMYGGRDSLVDIKIMLKELPRHTIVKEVPHFEHLDFLWAQEVDTLVFPCVFNALEEHAGRDHLIENRIPFANSRNGRYTIPHRSDLFEDDLSSPTTDTENTPARSIILAARDSHEKSLIHKRHLSNLYSSSAPSTTTTTTPSPEPSYQDTCPSSSPSPTPIPTDHYPITTLKAPQAKPATHRYRRSGSLASTGGRSQQSVDTPAAVASSTKRFSMEGISIGPAKPTVGLGHVGRDESRSGSGSGGGSGGGR